MAILVRFTPSGMTSEQYNSVGRKLQEAGDWPPPGMLAHVCFGSSGDLCVSEVWESREQQERFGEKLLPVLQQEGISMAAQPEHLEVEGFWFREASSQEGD